MFVDVATGMKTLMKIKQFIDRREDYKRETRWKAQQSVINLISEMNFDILLRQWTWKTISTLRVRFSFSFFCIHFALHHCQSI